MALVGSIHFGSDKKPKLLVYKTLAVFLVVGSILFFLIDMKPIQSRAPVYDIKGQGITAGEKLRK